MLCRRPVDVVRLAGPMAGAVGAVVANGRFDVAHVGLAELADVAPALGTIPAVLVPLDAWTLNVATAADAASGWRRRWLQHQRSLVETYTATPFGRSGPWCWSPTTTPPRSAAPTRRCALW